MVSPLSWGAAAGVYDQPVVLQKSNVPSVSSSFCASTMGIRTAIRTWILVGVYFPYLEERR